MKSKTLLRLFFLTCVAQVSAQSTFRISAYSGLKQASAIGGEVYLSYIDESPSQDQLESSFSVPAMKNVIPIGARFELELANHLALELGTAFLVGSQRTGSDYYASIGYGINKMNFRLCPKLGLGLSKLGYSLGDIYQNAVFIQVNDTRFYSNSVAMHLNERVTVLRPAIDISFPFSLGSDWEFFATAGYQYATGRTMPYLEFMGEDNNNQPVTATEAVNAPNVYLTINQRQVRGQYNKLSGVFFNMGVSYAF